MSQGLTPMDCRLRLCKPSLHLTPAGLAGMNGPPYRYDGSQQACRHRPRHFLAVHEGAAATPLTGQPSTHGMQASVP